MNNHVPSDEWCFMKWLKWQGNSTWTSISNIRSPRQKTTKQRILMRICWSFWTIVLTVTTWSLTWHVFFSLQTVAAHGLNLPGSMSGSASWKVHCRRFLCQNSVKLYAMVWNHKITWRFWNHMKLVTSWAPNLERSSSISPSRTSRPQLLLWRCFCFCSLIWWFHTMAVAQRGRI